MGVSLTHYEFNSFSSSGIFSKQQDKVATVRVAMASLISRRCIEGSTKNYSSSIAMSCLTKSKVRFFHSLFNFIELHYVQLECLFELYWAGSIELPGKEFHTPLSCLVSDPKSKYASFISNIKSAIYIYIYIYIYIK